MDIPVLKYLDILIGLAVVMALGTTVVAAATQLILASLYFRSRSLRMGLQELIRNLDPAQLSALDARSIAESILRHPVLARPNGPVGAVLSRIHNRVRSWRGLPPLAGANPADVIQRSELVMLLLEWAAGEGSLAHAENTTREIKDKLRRVLEANGIADPAAVLKAVRLKAIEKEKADPAEPAHVWWNGALLEEAASDLVGKVNQCFDNTIARVAQAFKLKANSVACAVSFVVAFSIQLDALALLKRLSVDDRLRDSLVREAEMLASRIEKVQQKDSDEAERARAARKQIDETLALMREPRFSILPDSREMKLERDRESARRRLPGVVLSWVLLSLGTPFWFNLLKNLLGLRSVLARKDDKERSERENQSGPPRPKTPLASV